jgi:hypothetical protein
MYYGRNNLGETTDEKAGWEKYGDLFPLVDPSSRANYIRPDWLKQPDWMKQPSSSKQSRYLAGGINWVVIAGVAGSLLVLTLLLRKK